MSVLKCLNIIRTKSKAGEHIAVEFNIGYVIAGINLLVAVLILIMTLVTAHRLKGSILQWSTWLFLVTGLLFATNAWIEVAGWGEELYALTALVATILLGFTLVIIDITTKVLGVKS